MNYNYYISGVQTSEVVDIESIELLKASSKELSNNATLEEIDLQTSEIPTSSVRHSTEVKTSEFLTSALLESRRLVVGKTDFKEIDEYAYECKDIRFYIFDKMFQEEKSNHKTDSAGLSIKYANKEHITYHFLLTGYYCHTIDECNELFHEQGFKSLSGEG